MPEQPQPRLVPRSRYVLLLSQWLLCCEAAITCSILGAGLLLIELYYLALQFALYFHIPIEVEPTSFGGPLALILIPAGVLLILAGRKLFVRTGKVMPFAPITSENTHLLPPAESLVRASMSGPQAQQAELLRATVEGQKTPQDQLLRADQSPR
jgi:hypothetical protein